MKNILVTGGFGFIGGHLVERLCGDKNNHVHVVDNLSSCPILYEELLDELGHPENLTYNLCTVATFTEVFQSYHPDSINPNQPVEHLLVKVFSQGDNYELDIPCHVYNEIYHLASPVGPAGVLAHAGQMIGMVVGDIYHLINLALRHKAKLVDVSTSEVYGGGESGLCAENMDKIVPAETTVRLEYAIAKLAAETAIINMCKVSDLQAMIVRPFNVAGARQSGEGGFVLPRFIEQAMNGEALTVFGDGEQVRAFTHVSDIVDGLMRVMDAGKNGEAYNLGNPANKTTINDLAERVNRKAASSAGVVHVDPKAIFGELYAEAAEKYPDASRAMTELGWSPNFDIEKTILDAYWYAVRRANLVQEGND